MSFRQPGEPLSPIVESSVPRCICQNSQPCTCERYADRLRLSQIGLQLKSIRADSDLAVAMEALVDLSRRGLSKELATSIAAVQAAREKLH